jgi:hypothetical protein
VAQCLYCGEKLPPAPDQLPAQRREAVPLIPRLIGPLFAGVSVALISCAVAWEQYRMSPVSRVPQAVTLVDIGAVQQAVESYRREKGRLPSSLDGVPPAAGAAFRVSEAGAPIDSWNRTLQYWTDGKRYRVVSWGRDGRAGGVGYDYDLSCDDLPVTKRPTYWLLVKVPDQAKPTFGQFLTDRAAAGAPASEGMLAVCFVSGTAAFLLALSGARFRAGSRAASGALVAMLIITVLATMVMTFLISVLHFPTGH